MTSHDKAVLDFREVTRVPKPWGHELIWAKTERYCGKVLHIKAGESLSLQYHEKKEETLYLLSGALELTVQWGDERKVLLMNPGSAFHVYPRLIHRMTALEDADVLEVSTPELDDVVRLEDRYGREGTSQA